MMYQFNVTAAEARLHALRDILTVYGAAIGYGAAIACKNEIDRIYDDIDRAYIQATETALFIQGEAFDPFDYLMGGPGVYLEFMPGVEVLS